MMFVAWALSASSSRLVHWLDTSQLKDGWITIFEAIRFAQSELVKEKKMGRKMFVKNHVLTHALAFDIYCELHPGGYTRRYCHHVSSR
jgi:hypothetical protein